MHHDIGPFIGLVAVLGFFSIPIIGVIGHFGHETIKAWLAMSLKRDMVARGYSAQEIIQVCQALGQKKLPPFKPITDVPPAKPIKQPAYSPLGQ